MKKRFLAALLCVAMALTLLPATAYAAGGYVLIEGVSLSTGTPYYFNGNGTSNSPTKDGNNWNAYLEINNGEYTLHLNGLSITNSSETTVISAEGIDTLYILLESPVNKVYTRSNDAAAAAIRCSNLVVYGNGTFDAKVLGTGGNGIVAGSIKLQYPTELIVEGATQATSSRVECSGGASAYTATGGGGGEITDYFSNTISYQSNSYVNFTTRVDARFPLWVNGERVTAQYKDSLVCTSGSATYTPARGSAPARLTLMGATINNAYTGDNSGSGVYTTEPLEIYLSGSNTIDFTASSYLDRVSGVFVDGAALTITADPGASLLCRIVAPSGSDVDCYGIRTNGSLGNVTINSGIITADGIAKAGNGFGIKADGSLTVNGGSLTAESESDDGQNDFAVGATSLSLGTNMAIITPANAIAPGGGANYIKNNADAAANYVEIGRSNAVTYDANGGPDTIYQITKGQSSNWKPGSTSGLRFTADGLFSKFMSVYVDGALISNDKYTAKSGSTIVTLKASYLSTLSAGWHPLRLNFTDGYAETYFTIGDAGAQTNPETGAQDYSGMAVALAVMAALCGAAAAVRKKKD